MPVEWSGNPSCQQLGYAHGFKVESQSGADYTGRFHLNSSYGILTDGAREDTVNHLVGSRDGTHLNWTSTLPLDLVFMKSGNGGNAHAYAPEDTAGTGLGLPDSGPALSHVEFATNVVGYPEITVTDSNGQIWEPVAGDASWDYSRTFSCSAIPRTTPTAAAATTTSTRRRSPRRGRPTPRTYAWTATPRR